jgi:hypothetical protein
MAVCIGTPSKLSSKRRRCPTTKALSHSSGGSASAAKQLHQASAHDGRGADCCVTRHWLRQRWSSAKPPIRRVFSSPEQHHRMFERGDFSAQPEPGRIR